ncbi:LapA family protein [Candidatus Nitrospira inopinata]|jgi:uncharacterized integral membrane protein|nr:LapA family protein [Candidatus Nitrospira inopinata]
MALEPDATTGRIESHRPAVGRSSPPYQTIMGVEPTAIGVLNTPCRHPEKGGSAMIRVILVGILLLLSLAFFLQNQEQEVTLRYFFGLLEESTPVYKPILAGFVVGLLVAGILLFPPWIRGRIELRRKMRALQEAEVDLERLRQSFEKLSVRPASPSSLEHPQDHTDER